MSSFADEIDPDGAIKPSPKGPDDRLADLPKWLRDSISEDRKARNPANKVAKKSATLTQHDKPSLV